MSIQYGYFAITLNVDTHIFLSKLAILAIDELVELISERAGLITANPGGSPRCSYLSLSRKILASEFSDGLPK